MKNILYQESIVEIKHLFHIMKITALALFIFAGTAFATESYSQVMKVTVVADKISTGKIINEIEKQTDYLFVYNVNEVNLKRTVQVNAENKSVAEVLNTVFAGTDIYYAMEGKNIMLMSKAKDIAQQSNKITGIIKDQEGEPIIGANITVKGQSIGTITDIDGRFVLEASANAIIQISYIGYVSQEVNIENKKNLNIILKEDTEMLDEVVVIGYGTMKKKDLTGAVSQVRPAELSNEAPKTVQDVLRGTAGLRIGFDGSAKGGGSMQVRGQRSVYSDGGHNDPLIILDGMIFYGELSEINPNDISQIDVLKDASSAAVYGAKAANGVVIVTTKKGRSEKPVINFSANVGFVTIGDNRKVYDADGYLKYREDFYITDTYGVNPQTGKYEAYQTGNTPSGYYNRPTEANLNKHGITLDAWKAQTKQDESMSIEEIWGRRLGLQASDITLNNFLLGRTFDWYDHSFHTGLNQDYNVSVSGNSKKVNYYISLGYLSNEGVARGNEYSAVRSNIKLDTQITPWLSVGANINFQNRTDGDIATNWESQILDNSPFTTPYGDNGELVPHPMGENAYWKGYNFDYDRQYMDLDRGYMVLNSILNSKVTLPFGITYQFNVAPRYQYYHNRYYQSSQHPDWQAETHNRVTRNQGKRFDWSLNNTITWDYTWAKKHHTILTLVQEAEERQSWADEIIARNILPSEALGLHGTANGDKNLSSFSSTDTRETACGYLARLFYSYNDTYMATFSFRRDGYSAFGTTNPYANFFSGALAWTFTNEKFWAWKPLSSGKLRLSFGQNGNRSLADSYLALANLSLGKYTQGYINAASGALMDLKYLFVSRLANPNLQWEKTTSWNIGLDLGFLNNRINASLEYYVMPTTDMIMNQSLPSFTGFNSITTNLGRIENRGFELSINSRNIEKENFKWETGFTLSVNKNTIKKLYGESETIIDAAGNTTTKERDDVTNGWFIGHPVSAIWDYKVTGIWQKDEVEEAAKYGQRPGDPKVQNIYTADDKVNADGSVTPVYNNKDKQFMGETTPPVHWSLRNNFTIYKNWSFSFNMYSYMGHKSLDTNYLNNDNSYSQITNCRNVYTKKYWTVDNPTNTYARLSAQGPTGISAPARVIDRSFIRLENISVAYNIPQEFLEKYKILNAKVFATVRNVATWSKEWEYGDPETGGLAPRTYSLGINLTF
ncbi:MAG: SusC/RagA family TonB-linked outer membrane protein [Bacteroides sp.]|jgi:tonB-linked outer membrane protein, susC/ragA family|uniref:SusC/RagA family TonB-linked outer membrane protein n=1 Tax=Bacteroides TaxID=816 RepID=UPI0004ACFE72|nr:MULTISPECIES: SusC/RagA family TonB-linked outer membrane protein [Bacteroides]MBS6240022.1 SusC/RagA family TonB-linked outer membrane protein [Bacteroides sp.]